MRSRSTTRFVALTSSVALAAGSALALTAAPASADVQAIFYASPTGQVGASCLDESTACSLEDARDAVRGVNANMTGDIHVRLLEGRYELSSTFALTSADSGTNGYRVIYEPEVGRTPVISGGEDISMGWTQVAGKPNLYSRSGVDWDFRQLYVGDGRAVRAREPNLVDELTGAPYFNTLNDEASEPSYPYEVDASQVGTWVVDGTAEMVVNNHWKQHRGRVASFSGGQIAFASPEAGFAHDHMGHGAAPFYFENAYDLLDTDGEWFLDSTTDTLYYDPRSDETMNSTEIFAPRIETLVSIQGSAANDRAHDVTIRGLSFEHSNWLAPDSFGYVDIQAGFRYQNVAGSSTADFGADARYAPAGSMISLEFTDHIRLESNLLRFSGAWGVMGKRGTSHTVIVDNTFTQMAGGGVALGVAGDQWTNQPESEGQSQFDSIVRNTVTRVGLDYRDSVGIAAMLPQNMVIQNNEVAYLPYTGISVGWNWGDDDHGTTNVQVSRNRIHHVVTLLDDGAGIYSLGRMSGGSTFSENYVSDIDRTTGGKVFPIAGIYLDNGSVDKTVSHNVVDGVPSTFWAWNQPNHDNLFLENWSNSPWGDIRPENTTTNNFALSGQAWPADADAVRSGAGTGGSPDSVPPGRVGDLSVSRTSSTGATLTWTAPGDDDGVGRAFAYELRYSLSPITSANWARATSIGPGVAAAASGSAESATVSGLAKGTTYYFAVRTRDEVDNRSQLSNSPSGSTLAAVENLALNTTATAYYADDSMATMHIGSGAEKAVDGSFATHAQATAQYVWKLQADLGSARTVDRIDVSMPPTAYATEFDLQTSTDGTTFTTVKQVTGFGSGLSSNDITPVVARYLRVVAVSPDGPYETGGQMSILELEAYDTSSLTTGATATALFADGSAAVMHAGHGAEKAVDGDIQTGAQAYGQYVWQLQVDLGSAQTVSRIDVWMPGAVYATAFDLQTSADGVNFTTVAQVTGFGSGSSVNYITPALARYLRVVAVSPNGPYQTGGQMRITEVDAY